MRKFIDPWVILGLVLAAFIAGIVLYGAPAKGTTPDVTTYPAYTECAGRADRLHIGVFNHTNKAITVRVDWMRNGYTQHETYRVGRNQGVLTGIRYRSASVITNVKVSHKGKMIGYLPNISANLPYYC